MPKMAPKVSRNGVLCYIAVSIIVWGADFGSSGRGQDMIGNIDSMILDPKYDAEHDTQLYSARKGFRNEAREARQAQARASARSARSASRDARRKARSVQRAARSAQRRESLSELC